MADVKIQTGVYKIDEEYTLEDIKKLLNEKNYTVQTLKLNEFEGFKLNLFYKKKPFTPKWKAFLSRVAHESSDIFQENISWAEEFILLFSKQENIYAVTGGAAFHALQDIIYKDFGIDILSRLISKEDKIIKSTRERSFVGSVLGITKHFRKNFNLHENDDFGKIYQELKADIDIDSLIEKFGFNAEDVKKGSVCIAKATFKITKSLSFEEIIKIIMGCESLLQEDRVISINNIQKISSKKDKDLIKKLEIELYQQLHDRFLEKSDAYPFDICHYEFEKYLTASNYVVMRYKNETGMQKLKNIFPDDFCFNELINIDDLFSKLRILGKDFLSREKFISYIKGIKIFSYDEEGNSLTSGDLLSHLLGDVSYNDRRFFYVEKNWYYIQDKFIDRLNEACAFFIESNFYSGLEEKWDFKHESENEYNKKYIGKENTIVLDKIIPENIELCDIMHWDENNLYLFHVKCEFGNTMRDLCAQISISANRMASDMIAKKDFAKKLYKALQKKKDSSDSYFKSVGEQTNMYSEEFFISLFEKDIFYVLSVLDTGESERSIKDIKKFNSNIAKFSIRALSKEMKLLDGNIGFKIAQIMQDNIAISDKSMAA